MNSINDSELNALFVRVFIPNRPEGDTHATTEEVIIVGVFLVTYRGMPIGEYPVTWLCENLPKAVSSIDTMLLLSCMKESLDLINDKTLSI
jgi:hypothetical protein